MNNNIFENAKFGDKFKTRNGRKAFYIHTKKDKVSKEIYHYVIIENDGTMPRMYNSYGSVLSGSYKFDIMSRLEDDSTSKHKELINEENLEKLASDEPQDGILEFDIVSKLEEKPIEEMTFKLHHLVGVGLNTCHGAINLLIEALKNKPGLLGKKYKLSIKWIEE